MNALTALAIFIGGGLGSLCRFALSVYFQRLDSVLLPWATISSNVLSSLILGVVVFKLSSHLSPTFTLLLAVGFCGGFSTFSTFSLETFQMLKAGQFILALVNVFISIVLCTGVLFLIYKVFK